jgi:glycosyltransferase involved in cell wall biosynthesis
MNKPPYQAKRMAAELFLKASLSYVRSALGRKARSRDFGRVCVVAALGKGNGIAKGAMLQYQALQRLGIDADLVDVTSATRNPFKRVHHKPGTAYVFHSGGPQIATLMTSVLPHAKDAYRVAYWAWELPIPPRRWPDARGLVSEIWTCSDYAKRSLEKSFPIPVYVVPPPVAAEPAGEKSQDRDAFQVLVVADSRSSLARKNLKGSIAAFNLAFQEVPGARLIIKFRGDPSDLEPFIGCGANKKKISVINRFLSAGEMSDLYRSSDVLLSLHRAEGFGLPMLEAMAHGTPVVASRWSGNLEFMNDQNSFLVDCSLTPILDETVYSGYSDASWADPNISQAATLLAQLRQDLPMRRLKSRNAQITAQNLVNNWRLPCTGEEQAQVVSAS